MSPKLVHHLGTFDVENYGDLLYPLIFPHLVTTAVRHYSLLAGDAPHAAGFQTQSSNTLFESKEPVMVVIGGGDILRTDSELMARHYGRNSRLSYDALRQSIGVSGLIGYGLRDKLPRVDAGDFYAKRFRARWMSYPAVGPFILAREDLPPGSAVCYVSCGVPHAFPPGEFGAIKRAFEQAEFIYLRDEESADKLRHAGVNRELHVAPDLAVIVSDIFPAVDAVQRGRELLSSFGIDTARPVLCFQSQPYPGFSEAEILDQLTRYRVRTKAEVALLPLGYCHGDHEFLQSLAKRANGLVNYAGVNSILDMMAIIAACDAFVGTSLHGNITAFAYGVPHVVGPLPVAKAGGFLKVADLPAELKLNSWTEMNAALDRAMLLGRSFFSEKARVAKQRVYAVVEEFRKIGLHR